MRASTGKTSWIPTGNKHATMEMEGKVIETWDAEDWARMYREVWPDAVLTSQLFFNPTTPDAMSSTREKFVDMLGELRDKQPTPVYM